MTAVPPAVHPGRPAGAPGEETAETVLRVRDAIAKAATRLGDSQRAVNELARLAGQLQGMAERFQC